MSNRITRDLLKFIENSPSCFHVVEGQRQIYLAAGFTELMEQEEWQLESGGKYFTTRNGSACIAFAIPRGSSRGFHFVASHSDSPSFKVKENPEMEIEGHYVKLNTEKYGGPILSTWMDRPLSVAGRVSVLQGEKIVTKLVNVDKDLLIIPSVAPHLGGTASEYNPQVDLLPLYAGKKGTFIKYLAKAAEVEEKEILSYDLFLYVREKGRILGAAGEFVVSPKLDDLQCAYASILAMSESEPTEYINVCAVFDNEEVGSGTKQGAGSTFLEDVLARICEALNISRAGYHRMIAESFMISADNAHAVHPNHPEKSDPTNRPYLNGGIVLKYHGSQRYATDAISAGILKHLCHLAGVPCQTYTNRSDIAGGSTLGNISTGHVSVNTVDIGLPQLAMHSALETAGVQDTEYAVKMMKVFYGQ